MNTFSKTENIFRYYLDELKKVKKKHLFEKNIPNAIKIYRFC